ncbi:MAG: hypothetical protein ACLUVG_21150 [Phocaeicola vulgatus]
MADLLIKQRTREKVGKGQSYNKQLYPTKIVRGDRIFITAYTEGISSSILGYIEDDLAPSIKSTSIDSSKNGLMWISEMENTPH